MLWELSRHLLEKTDMMMEDLVMISVQLFIEIAFKNNMSRTTAARSLT